jgi:hypothetical protein
LTEKILKNQVDIVDFLASDEVDGRQFIDGLLQLPTHLWDNFE